MIYLSKKRPPIFFTNGFSLLEVMVAVAILGISVVALFQVFSAGLRGTKKVEDYTRALIIGRSLMDEAYTVPDPEELSGVEEFDGGFTTRREVTELPSDDINGILYLIEVEVQWGRKGRLILRGKRFIPAGEAG
ncbi:MAG: prepilin-type N-terminal cleavage/methylation domain-containing protein [Nitrospirae bacterium]|nr:MAG: prepilin-type N-terminal cleavage/methylation domain-containing protein [Nitrospirota bacterium]